MVIYQITFKQDFFNFHFKLSSKIFIIISTILFLPCAPWSYSFDANTEGFSYSDKTFSDTDQPDHAAVLVAQSTRRARNKRPTLNLVANPSTGESPLYVTFDANASDPDGYIVEYRWDYDGNGTVDDITTSKSGEFIYIIPGTYYAKVKVIDNRQGSASDLATVKLSSPPQPSPTPTPNPTSSPSPTTSQSGPAFYISPTGSDSNPGTSDRPWKTWKYALNLLGPGDTLIVKDGTYTKSTTGLPNIYCGSGGVNDGLEGSPITIKAENERQAFLKSDGSVAALRMQYCSYWDIIGLRGASSDLSSANGGAQYSIFQIDNSSNITLKRLLATHPNRDFNVHSIILSYSSDSLVEECEAYSFHRHGIDVFRTQNITIRRSYVNSRGTADIAGFVSRIKNRGDEGIICYTSNGCIIENSISEGNDQISFGDNGNGYPPNKVLGSIVIDENSGFDNFGEAPSNLWSVNALLQDSVAIRGNAGVMQNSVRNGQVKNVTVYKTGGSGLLASIFDSGLTNPSFTAVNVLSWANSGNEFTVNKSYYTGSSWLLDYCNAGGGTFSPTETSIADASGNIQHSLSVAPTLMGLGTNQCIVYVPGGHDGNGGTNPLVAGGASNMAGAGKNGEDIGANIVYRYEDGVLTYQKLWDQTTGQFPCGATVQGVNDESSFPDSSCVNVHYRLNAGTNGCPIP